MADFFFYGTLCHQPLLDLVLGRVVVSEPATLADHAVFWAEGQAFPMLQAQAGAKAVGVYVADLSGEDIKRLDFYEGDFTATTAPVTLTNGRQARVYTPEPDSWGLGKPWDLAEWQASHAEVVVEAAREFMSLFGHRPVEQALRRYPMMLSRAASRLRAQQPVASTLRHVAKPGDVDVQAWRQPYGNFFAVEEFDLRFRRFDGSWSGTVNRAAFVSADAATVLPWDPVRDRVLVVEQFRPGPFARGDANPWLIEAVAGRVDPFESPEDCARREAEEEAGVTLQELIEVARYYPSPGAKTEYLYSYVALCDLPDLAPRHGGLATEAEDIRAHILSWDEFMALMQRPEAANGPLLLTAMWLAANRERLRPKG